MCPTCIEHRVGRQAAAAQGICCRRPCGSAHLLCKEGFIQIHVLVHVVVHDDARVAHIYAVMSPVNEFGAQRLPQVRGWFIELLQAGRATGMLGMMTPCGMQAAQHLSTHNIAPHICSRWRRIPVIQEGPVCEDAEQKDGDRCGKPVRQSIAKLRPACADSVYSLQLLPGLNQGHTCCAE